MAVQIWILEDDGKTLRADIPNSGVTFTVTPVDKPEQRIERVSRVYIRSITRWPPTELGHYMAASLATCTLLAAKKNAVRSFQSWADSAVIEVTGDGHGNIILDLEDNDEK